MNTRTSAAAITMVAAACLLAAACGGGGNDAADAGDEIASLGTTAETETPSTGTAADASNPDGTSVEGPTDPEEAMLAFTECMREHGIDMPDPAAAGEGEVGAIAVTIEPGDAEEMDEAQEECAPLMENARNEIELDPERQAEIEAEMLEFAQCMRDHGIEMEDPVFADDGGMMINMTAGSAPEDGNGGPPREDEEFQAAMEECGGPGGPEAVVNVEEGEGD